MKYTILILLLLFFISPALGFRCDVTVGNSTELTSALDNRVLAGQTLCLHSGRYYGRFVSNLTGTAQQSITVRPISTKKTVLDAGSIGYGVVLEVRGAYTHFIGLEITNSAHITRQENFGFVDTSIGILDSCLIGCKYINNVIHNNGGGGVGSFNNGNSSEFYGNIIFLNGSERHALTGAGHGLYLQNTSPDLVKGVKDNLSFMNFAFNMQAYTDSNRIDNLRFEGNSFFLPGRPSSKGATYNFLIGGGDQPFTGFEMRSNYTYGDQRTGSDSIGWGGTPCISPQISDNYFASGYFNLGTLCSNPNVVANTFYSTIVGQHPFANNTYYSSTPPDKAFVRPNLYDPDSAFVIVYNWSRQDEVSVDLSSILTRGDSYEIIDAQNVGKRIRSSYYRGSPISIPMTYTAVAPVYGSVAVTPAHSDKEFGVFIVRRFNVVR